MGWNYAILSCLLFCATPSLALGQRIIGTETKKDKYLGDKLPTDAELTESLEPPFMGAPEDAAPEPVEKPPESTKASSVINIYNKWTNEFVVVDASAADASNVDRNTFFRCHFTGEPTEMDPRLVQSLVRAARRFKVDRVNIVSGYRAPKYNLILRKKGRQVARESQHTQGNAVDFRLPGVPTRRLYLWARRQNLGGVGFYPKSGFVHMDTGPVRTWSGK